MPPSRFAVLWNRMRRKGVLPVLPNVPAYCKAPKKPYQDFLSKSRKTRETTEVLYLWEEAAKRSLRSAFRAHFSLKKRKCRCGERPITCRIVEKSKGWWEDFGAMARQRRIVLGLVLTVFLTANSLSSAHFCLPVCSCHHDEAETACSLEDGHDDADHASCPCDHPQPHKPSCPCPHECPSCHLAKTPSTVAAVPCLEAAVCVGLSPCEVPPLYVAPYSGKLIRPPRA